MNIYEADRLKAQKSTGPKTPEGKAIASQNALKTGLTGRRILLPSDDAALYEKHIERFRADFNPATDRERELVQSLADTQWRLNRIPRLEMGIFYRGRALYEILFLEIQDPEMRALAVESHTHAVHTRDLNNLSIQESRLRRNYAKDLAELKALQAQRDAASKPAQASQTASRSNPAEFVFSTSATAAATNGLLTSDRSPLQANSHNASVVPAPPAPRLEQRSNY